MAHSLNNLIKETVSKNGSDLHINVGIPPQIRIDGRLTSADSKILSSEETYGLCTQCLNKDQIKLLESNGEIDLGYEVEGLTRIRANIYKTKGGVAGAFRTIPFKIPSPKEIGLPESVVNLTLKPRGLVLVTGQTGSGKSTTLASLIETINQSRYDHIITIEDPIEYVYKQKRSTINQREVHSDTKSFVNALKYILRQDPDVVLIGEMRDLETIQSALTVAETGHLVFATLHTNTAVQTINRIIDVFPPHQQMQIKTQLSFILEGVISQQLLPCIGGGRTLAMELMLPNSAIRNLIREGKTHQIYAELQMGQQESNMVTMDQSLASLVKSRKIEKEEAMLHCVDISEFKAHLGT